MKKLRWVLAGVGDIATKRVLPAIQSEPRSELVGVVSRDAEKGRRWAEQVWGTVEEALEWGEFDALYVATPVALHAPQSMAALRAGKHVLCEKPTAMNAAEAGEMARVIAFMRLGFYSWDCPTMSCCSSSFALSSAPLQFERR